MHILHRLSNLSLLLLFLALNGCTAIGFEASTSDDKRKPISDNDAQSVDKFSKEIRIQLSKENFQNLESIAQDLRATKARFPGGDWKLYRYYQALGTPEGGRKDTDSNWQTHIQNLQRWVAKYPSSITAHIAFGEALTSYAWKARGDGFANTVTEEGWELFRERLAQAEEVMRKAGKLQEKCPQWYCVMQDIALGLSWDLGSYNKLFDEAIGFEPHYLHFYSNKARYLMPRWHGGPGDWEKFADETAKRVGGKEGSMLYSHIAWQVSKFHQANTFFGETQASWPRVKQGFIDREELYGTSNRILNAFVKLAAGAADKQTARELFSRIGEGWDEDVWKEKIYFDRFKEWVFN